MQFSDIMQEKLCYLFCCDSSIGQNKMSSFQPRVHNCYYYIIFKRLRKFYHEINTQSISQKVWDWQQIKLTNWEMLHRLGPKTKITSTNILANILWHLRLPIFHKTSFNIFYCPVCPTTLVLWYRETIQHLRSGIYGIYILFQKKSRPFASNYSEECKNFIDKCWSFLVVLVTVSSCLSLWFLWWMFLWILHSPFFRVKL